MDFDLELVASFVTVVDEWHFGRAADELFITASALTKRIQRLERLLSVTLLERGPEGLTGLTPAGLELAAAARPLLRQARSAARATTEATSSGALRVGLPSGTGAFLPALDHLAVAQRFRQHYPNRRVALVEVPFPLINRCLPEGRVDVLLTIAAICHGKVESTPLPMTSARIGVVSDRHALAGAAEVGVTDMCEQRLLHNPDIPGEWMRPFWLGDVRTRAEAQLSTSHASNHDRVYHDIRMGSAAIVTLATERGLVPKGMQALELKGAEPVNFYAASRQRDHRSGALAYVALLAALVPAHTA